MTMKTAEQIRERLTYTNTSLKKIDPDFPAEGPTEDAEVIYTRAYADALIWVLTQGADLMKTAKIY